MDVDLDERYELADCARCTHDTGPLIFTDRITLSCAGFSRPSISGVEPVNHYPDGLSFEKAPLDAIKQGSNFEWLSKKAQRAS